MEKSRRQTLLSWVSIILLAGLCGVLGVLQYRWIGEVSRAEYDRLKAELQADLQRLSREFNAEINTLWSVLPEGPDPDATRAYATRFQIWKDQAQFPQIVRRLGVAIPAGEGVDLCILDPTGGMSIAQWPAEWLPLRERLIERLNRTSRPGPITLHESGIFELPRFSRSGSGPGRPRELDWLIVELDLEYIRNAMIPALLTKHLSRDGKLDYEAWIVSRRNSSIIYSSYSQPEMRVASQADSAATLFEVRYDPPSQRLASIYLREEPDNRTPPLRFGDTGQGRWDLFIRHRDQSLDSVVDRARWRNIAMLAAILLLMAAAVTALIRFTRQSQRLAHLQMNFVAGISHELRTPLAVISTAAYNLKGPVANHPNQVERYGALIQDEADKLTTIVEDVLRFAVATSGRLIQQREPVSIAALISDGVQSRTAAENIEMHVDPGLPVVLGDAMALKHAIQNLVSNAVKYGAEGGWIGIYALADPSGQSVEIRVLDRGPGIPADEQGHIFDAFYRGRQAIQDQIHGTGLGLNLVKRIAEAHGGTIQVRSEPGKGSEFILRLPSAPAEYQDEFAHSLG